MTSSIDDPFQLASYTSSSKWKWKGKATTLDHVSTAPLKTSKREGYVTVSTQADGIHLLDVSTLHPLASHTLGPSTSFSCPAITTETSANQYTTYAAIESSSDFTSAEQAGHVIWKWSGDKKKGSKTITQRIHSLHYASAKLLVVTATGEIHALDAETMEVKATVSVGEATSVFQAFVLADERAAVAFFNAQSRLQLKVLSSDSLSTLGDFSFPHKADAISTMSLSSSGHLSVLTKAGEWHAYALPLTSSCIPRPLAAPITLAKLSTPTILALTSSHVLLAAASKDTIHIQIWDLQYSVLLAAHSLPVPSTFAPGVKLRLSQGPDVSSSKSSAVIGQAMLTLTPLATKGEKNITSNVMVVPYTVPAASTIAAALGRGSSTKAWLKSTEAKDSGSIAGTVRAALEAGNTRDAEKAFEAWMKEADKNITHAVVKDLLAALLPPLKSNGRAPYAHSAEILKTLFAQKLVSNGMVEGGLLPALKARGDWSSIELAFGSVQDLPADNVIQCLLDVTQIKSQPDAMEVDTAPPALPAFLTHTINYLIPSPIVPSLSSTTATPAQVIVALKKHFKDPSHVASLAEVLVAWVRTYRNQRKVQDLGIWPSNKDLEKNADGVAIYSLERREKRLAKDKAGKGPRPSFEKIIAFLQPFLDATFLPLLTHAPSHVLLAELQKHLAEEEVLAELLIQLQGSLEPFSVGHQKIIREASVPEKEREREKHKGDWRARKAAAGGAPSVVGAVGSVGLYQLEELVF